MDLRCVATDGVGKAQEQDYVGSPEEVQRQQCFSSRFQVQVQEINPQNQGPVRFGLVPATATRVYLNQLESEELRVGCGVRVPSIDESRWDNQKQQKAQNQGPSKKQGPFEMPQSSLSQE